MGRDWVERGWTGLDRIITPQSSSKVEKELDIKARCAILRLSHHLVVLDFLGFFMVFLAMNKSEKTIKNRNNPEKLLFSSPLRVSLLSFLCVVLFLPLPLLLGLGTELDSTAAPVPDYQICRGII